MAKLINKKNYAENVKPIEMAMRFHADGYVFWEYERCTRKNIFSSKKCKWETYKVMPKDFGKLKDMGFIAVSESHWKIWIAD